MGQFVIRVKQCSEDNVLSALGGSVVQSVYAQGDNRQLWTVELNQYKDGDDLVPGYSIINVGTGLAAKYVSDGSQVALAPNEWGNTAFVWRLDSVGEGFYAINRWDRNEVMDVKGDSCDSGTPVLTYGWNGGDNQRWMFDPA